MFRVWVKKESGKGKKVQGFWVYGLLFLVGCQEFSSTFRDHVFGLCFRV